MAVTNPPQTSAPSEQAPYAPLPPEIEKQVADSTLFIERSGGGLEPDYPVSGSGVVVSGSAGRDGSNLIVTNLHVALGNITKEVYEDGRRRFSKKPDVVGTDGKPTPAEINVYTKDHVLIGTAEVVPNGYGYDHKSGMQEPVTGDQSVLHIVKFAPGMEEKYSHLGIPLAKTQSDTTLAFRHADGSSIKHGNSGGPVVNMQGELIGLNTAVYEDANTPEISPMSNPRILRALGNAGKNIKTQPNNGPVHAAMFGHRPNSFYSFSAELYPYTDPLPGTAPRLPPVSQAFASAERETTRPGYSQEPLFNHASAYSDAMPAADRKTILMMGHNDSNGQTYVNYKYDDHHVVTLYFADREQKIIPWMREQYNSDRAGFHDKLLGDNRDGQVDVAKLYNTLNEVAGNKSTVIASTPGDRPTPAPQPPPTPAVVASVSPPAPSPSPPAGAVPSPSTPATPASPAPTPPPVQHRAPHRAPVQVASGGVRHHTHPAQHTAAAEQHEASTNRLNDMEYYIQHPELPVEKDAAYLATEKNLIARHKEIEADSGAQPQTPGEPHNSNLQALKSQAGSSKGLKVAASNSPTRAPHQTI